MTLPMLKKAPMTATMDDLFNQFFDRQWRFPFMTMPAEPAVDVFRQNGTVVVKAAMPGAKPDEIEASVEGDILTLRRTYDEATEEKDKTYFYKEQRTGSFYRQIQLPEAVEAGKVEAELKDGMLTLKAPVATAAATKPIKTLASRTLAKAGMEARLCRLSRRSYAPHEYRSAIPAQPANDRPMAQRDHEGHGLDGPPQGLHGAASHAACAP
ncbi:MAG TPA: Hsp20/alpha crystallin family protein [Chloroflexota bacterium]|nr:Hsp20/alpha crystallin family protein [Chloroflexota bacterium]